MDSELDLNKRGTDVEMSDTSSNSGRTSENDVQLTEWNRAVVRTNEKQEEEYFADYNETDGEDAQSDNEIMEDSGKQQTWNKEWESEGGSESDDVSESGYYCEIITQGEWKQKDKNDGESEGETAATDTEKIQFGEWMEGDSEKLEEGVEKEPVSHCQYTAKGIQKISRNNSFTLKLIKMRHFWKRFRGSISTTLQRIRIVFHG